MPKDFSFHYQLLSRLQMDCEYFLGNGLKNPKHLWADTPEEHIAEMYKQHDIVPEKPEWLTLEQIKEYEAQMI